MIIQRSVLQATTVDNTWSIKGDDWDLLKKVLYKSAESVLDFQKQRNRDWFDENNTRIQSLLKKGIILMVKLTSVKNEKSTSGMTDE